MKMYKSIFRKGSHTYLTPDEFSMLLQIISVSIQTQKEATIKLIGNDFTVYNSLAEKGWIREDENETISYKKVDADIQYFILEVLPYEFLKENKYSNNAIYLHYMMMVIDGVTYGEAMEATGLKLEEIEELEEKLKKEKGWDNYE